MANVKYIGKALKTILDTLDKKRQQKLTFSEPNWVNILLKQNKEYCPKDFNRNQILTTVKKYLTYKRNGKKKQKNKVIKI